MLICLHMQAVNCSRNHKFGVMSTQIVISSPSLEEQRMASNSEMISNEFGWVESDTCRVCVDVCACARARMRACERVCVRACVRV